MKFFKLPTKEEIRTKLDNYPALNAVVCLLLFERWFRVVFFAFLLLIPVVLMGILKVWRVTPQDFDPPVKISGIDFIQARSLRRTAVKEAEAGRHDDSFYAWRIAIANNPGDPDLFRSCLRQLTERVNKRKYSSIVMGYSSWLMRLTSTNLADLELSARAYEAYQLNDLTVHVLGGMEEKLTPPLHAIYLKALFNRGEISRFANHWEKIHAGGVTLSDPDILLYHAAYLAGWGPHREAAEAAPKLEQARQDPATRDLAHRLQLKVSQQLVQIDQYRESLEYLKDRRLDTLTDQVGLWQLLAMTGQKQEAIQMLRAHVRPPDSGEEAVVLAMVHFNLGFPDEARDLLKRYAPEFSESEAVWISYANLLTEQRRWDDLFAVAVQLRHEAHPLRDILASYSHFLQGLAEANRGQRESARDSFRKLIQASVRNKLWELGAAETIERLGYADIARELLLDIQKEVPDTPEYWLLLGKTAYDTKDPHLLVNAMAAAYKLRPDDYIVINNYAAALLSTRERPEQALLLTERVLHKMPHLTAARINHALALLQNSKLNEAETLLGLINESELREQELTFYHFAALELNAGKRRYDLARTHLDKIELQYLFSTERERLEALREEVQGPAAGAAKNL